MPDAPAPADAPDRDASHGPLVANLLGQIAFGLLAMTICLPSMQEWGAIFAVDQAAVQLTFSAYLVAYGGAQLLYGPLSDRHGRRRLLMIGLAVALVGTLAAALAPTLPTLIAARFVQGAGSAAGMVVCRAMVQDLFVGPERTRVMAYVGMALGLCPPLATVIGGQLHVHFGWQANFVLMAGLAVLLFLAAWRWLPPRRSQPPRHDHLLLEMAQGYTRLAREPEFLGFAAMLALTTGTFYAFMAGAPTVLASYGVGPAGVGWYIMCVPFAYIAGNFMTSHLVHRLSSRQMMVTGQLLTLASLGIVLALGLSGLHTPFAFTLPLILLGIGHGLMMPATLAGSVGVVPMLAGTAAAVCGLLQQLSGAFGGYVVGLVDHHGAVNLAWILLAFTVASSLSTALLFLAQMRATRRA